MATYALIKNNIVENVIVVDQNIIDSYFKNIYDYCIEYGESDYIGIGFIYDDNTKIFTCPIKPAPIEQTEIIGTIGTLEYSGSTGYTGPRW